MLGVLNTCVSTRVYLQRIRSIEDVSEKGNPSADGDAFGTDEMLETVRIR